MLAKYWGNVEKVCENLEKILVLKKLWSYIADIGVRNFRKIL